MMKPRPSFDEMFLNVAKDCAMRSTCIRKKYGAVIVSMDNRIISTGYNGAARGCVNCSDINYCAREKLHIPSGERYEICRSVHAEANAIINAGAENCIGATLYLYGMDAKTGNPLDSNECCMMCKRMILNAQISRIVRYSHGKIACIENVSNAFYNDDQDFLKDAIRDNP